MNLIFINDKLVVDLTSQYTTNLLILISILTIEKFINFYYT
jgi:hypothetical protein